jgi:hypothetical protein
MEPGKVRGVEHRAATDAVEIGHRDRRPRIVDRIVRRAAAHIGIETEVTELTQFPVPSRGRILGRLHPVALFETHDAHPGVRHAPGERRARSTCANDQYVNLVL